MVMVQIAIMLGVLGAAMGSFVDALVWRIHTRRNFVSDRSECEKCHHKLGVLDLLPIVSWLALGGRCRYCKTPISPVIVLTEIAMATLFVISYVFWPFGLVAWQTVALFVIWLVVLVMLGMLLVYDLRWMILPDKIVFPLIIIGFVDAALRVSLMPDATITTYASHILLGMGVIAGSYWLLYTASKGKWVGYGDVKLNIFIGTVLGWQKALLVLCMSNVLGFLIVLPGLLTGKLTRRSRIPFGPFLILAFVIASLFGDAIIEWYLNISNLAYLI
jgi:prepilin signal peptidase PulO-like enzyme (type II secretory pathway)